MKQTPVVLEGLDMSSAKRLLRANALDRAAALSSYNNNSNNPRRGTDRLRGAW
jgi:hypothetical protein